MAMPPYAWKKAPSMEAIYEYYEMISQAAGLPVWVQNNPPPIGIVMSPDFLNRMCDEIEHVEYLKEETPPSTLAITRLLESNTGSCKGIMGGAGGRYLIEEHRRGACGQMPGCHVTDGTRSKRKTAIVRCTFTRKWVRSSILSTSCWGATRKF